MSASATDGQTTGVRWERIDALIDASPDLRDLRTHGLQMFAARHWRALGRPLPGDLSHEEMQVTWRTTAAPRVLEVVRAACDGPVILIKGPAVAAHYPDPKLRPFVDLDLIVADARAAQASLLAAGFGLTSDPDGYPDYLHHLPPIHLPNVPLPIEVHSRLKWVDGMRQPSFETLVAAARPAALGVDGILTLPPAEHALVVAAHLWAHDPLTHLLRILDVAVLRDDCEPGEIEALARAWGCGRMWHATAAVVDSLYGAGSTRPWPLRTWARGLRIAREPSVTELHLSRLLTPLAIHTPVPAARALGAALAGFALPHDGETWRRKIARTVEQATRPAMRRSEHVKSLKSDHHAKKH